MTTLLHNYQWSSHSFKLFNLLIQLNIPQDMFISAKWPFTFWRPRISGVYDRQDVDLDLGDSVTLPALITVFLAAFLASLVGSSLVGNMTRMLSLEFKVPEPLKIRAIPLGNEYEIIGHFVLIDQMKIIVIMGPQMICNYLQLLEWNQRLSVLLQLIIRSRRARL